MGSFGEKGFASGMPIVYGDKTVLIFYKNGYERKKNGGNVYIVDKYKPVFLPIFGEYDDYGRIDDIVEDVNVKFIEKFFGESIESIIEKADNRQVGRGYTEKELSVKENNDFFKDISFGLELQEFYDFYTKPLPSFIHNYCGEYWLPKLGWVFKNKDKNSVNRKKIIENNESIAEDEIMGKI